VAKLIPLAAEVINGAGPRTASALRPTPLFTIVPLLAFAGKQGGRLFSAGFGNLSLTVKPSFRGEEDEEKSLASFTIHFSKSIFLIAAN